MKYLRIIDGLVYGVERTNTLQHWNFCSSNGYFGKIKGSYKEMFQLWSVFQSICL